MEAIERERESTLFVFNGKGEPKTNKQLNEVISMHIELISNNGQQTQMKEWKANQRWRKETYNFEWLDWKSWFETL